MNFVILTAGGFQFGYPWALAALIFVPLVAYWLLAPSARRKRTPTFLFSNAHRLSDGPRGIRIYLRPVVDLLFVLGLIALVVAIARPQVVEYDEDEVEGIDIFVAFDMSGSMSAIDVDEDEVRELERRDEAPKTRFEEAKDTLVEFVESRPDDRIGIVLFGRETVLQFPLTLDHGLLREQIMELELGDIDSDGTAIGNAVGRSLAGLEHSEAESRIVILITDGDRRGGSVSPMKSADMAKTMGVPVYPVLVGRDGPALVEAGQDPFSGRPSYRNVEFPINPELMQEMADHTGGQYFRALDAVAMADDLHEILDEYDQTQLEDRGRPRQREYYVPFVIAALLLFSTHFFFGHTAVREFP